jgi:hypothetical protein
MNAVIGYYESWGDRLACHKMAPTDLPCEYDFVVTCA